MTQPPGPAEISFPATPVVRLSRVSLVVPAVVALACLLAMVVAPDPDQVYIAGLAVGVAVAVTVAGLLTVRRQPGTLTVSKDAVRLWDRGHETGVELARADGGLLRVAIWRSTGLVSVIGARDSRNGLLRIAQTDLPKLREAALANHWAYDGGQGLELAAHLKSIQGPTFRPGIPVALGSQRPKPQPRTKPARTTPLVVAGSMLRLYLGLLLTVVLVGGGRLAMALGLPAAAAAVAVVVVTAVVLGAWLLLATVRANRLLRIGERHLWLDNPLAISVLDRDAFGGFQSYGPLVRIRTVQGRTFAVLSRKSAKRAEQALLEEGWTLP